ncbi:Kcc4p [Rhizophagus irregularis DAOM 197198w]|uniref:Kcc4p n=1 Tax=Rhizophagus irregularis (strain DAOM 197198w) TaxID=1432141 RepID=A0A015IU03_RHIIW|nr:Kcc4p [Rhizophagus irregularis DAOM 197198w]
MATIRREFVNDAIQRADALTDPYIRNYDVTKRFEFVKQTILDDESLTKNEKWEAIKIITNDYDYIKVKTNEGTKRLCENCALECLATLYCEHCVRTYLKNNFSNWTSGNSNIDNLIQECQMETFSPDRVIEWIPYNNLQDIKYITKGGCSEIYSAIWIDGRYIEWNSKEQQLKRSSGTFKVILKKLENVENANRSWFDEAKSHLTLSNKQAIFTKCYGLTQDSINGDYMLVMRLMDTDLRKYMQQQHTWKEKINIVDKIIFALYNIHFYGAVHRDLHSGNILHSKSNDSWYISDFGFCGPADKPLKSIYGNLPYIAPEVIIGKEYTFASDIYSLGILMWEISSGQTPFNNYEHDYDLAMKIVNGMRPKIRTEIPSKYKELMKQCWDADPLKRPNADTLCDEIEKMMKDIYSNDNANEFNTLEYNNSSQISSSSSNLSSSSKLLYSLSTSKLHQFENLPEPRNATEEEQEGK